MISHCGFTAPSSERLATSASRRSGRGLTPYDSADASEAIDSRSSTGSFQTLRSA